MDIKPALKKLEDSLAFKEWHKKNKDTYFSYAFKIQQEMPDEWQLGFYDKKKDKITTFVVNDSAISIRPEEEVFKKEESKVNEINLEKVKLTFEAVLGKANEFQQKNYQNDKSIKTIAILQNIVEYGTIWNITYVTEAFNTLNMKIDASNGKVVEHKLSSVFDFRKE
jgi:hypothetical protein